MDTIIETNVLLPRPIDKIRFTSYLKSQWRDLIFFNDTWSSQRWGPKLKTRNKHFVSKGEDYILFNLNNIGLRCKIIWIIHTQRSTIGKAP